MMAALRGRSGGEGTDWLQEMMKWPITVPPPIPFKTIDVFHIYVTLMNLHLAKSAVQGDEKPFFYG